MKKVGIESINAYCGLASVEVSELFQARGFDPGRMANLMMARKTVALPCEDPVTYAVNAARPLLAQLDEEQRNSIELLVVGTESGIDFSKSLGTWVHGLLGLPRNCRTFEIKQACYGGIAALQTAIAHVSLSVRPNARALVIGCDVPWVLRGTTLEPSQGAGAVAALIGSGNCLAVARQGAAGYCSFDVTDLRRPTPDEHILDADLSLVSYVDCLKGAYADYVRYFPETDFLASFRHLVFHTPFPGGVKGFHRSLMRSLGRYSLQEIDEDFTRRLLASIRYPSEVGNIYAATTLLALLSLFDNAVPSDQKANVGIFSYGSGCSSEFCTYELSAGIGKTKHNSGISDALAERVPLSIDEYDRLVDVSAELRLGAADYDPGLDLVENFLIPRYQNANLLMLKEVKNYQRQYITVGGAGHD